MAWTNPITFVSGAILTAAQMNVIQDNLLAGQPIFTDEAARDAVITAPEEGMVAYLTAPTVPAATGATFSTVPTGITTIYNGSNWVCVTPISAKSNTSGTTTATSYATTLTSDGTAVSVTLTTGTTALVTMAAQGQGGVSVQNLFVSFSVSGATTIAAADAQMAVFTAAGNGFRGSIARDQVISGLTAGTNTFTLNYKVGSNTGTYLSRDLTVVGIA